jgi:hypothetical protein
MSETNYFAVVNNELEKLKRLNDQRVAIDVEIVKVEQFISATANLLPDGERNLVLDTMESIQEVYRLRETGLTDAIRVVLKSSNGKWFTVANVRDHLVSAGFDFSTYTANPLASISTTLRRMKSEDVETTKVDGSVTAYRWKGEKSISSIPLSVLSGSVKFTGSTLLTGGNLSEERIANTKGALFGKPKK